MTTVPATTGKKSIQAYLQDPYIMQQIERAIPKHMTTDRLLRVFLTCLQGNDKLMRCTPKSLLGCLMTSAQLGIEPNPATGHAALIPYGSEAQFQIMYKGLLALVRRSGELRSVQAQVVYTKDRFVLQYGLEDKLEHIPDEGDRGDPKGAYCVFRYKDGGYSFDYMSKYDIEKVRETSKAANSGPWVDHWGEMAKKTVIKRHCKLAPVSIEVQTANALDDRIQMGGSQMDLLGESDPIDTTAISESEEQAQQDESVYWGLSDSLGYDDQCDFIAFTEETAAANNTTVGEVACSVTEENRGDFLESFREWQKKREPQQARSGDGPTDQENLDWETIKNLKTKGFTSYMVAYGRTLRTKTPWMKKNLDEKCRAIFGISLEEKLKSYDDQGTGVTGTDPDTGAAVGSGRLLDCPNMKVGEQVYESECQKCDDREKCPSHD